MCIHINESRSNQSRCWLMLGKYQPFDCELCMNCKKLEKLEFCGKFSILYAQLEEFNFHLQSKLIRLEEQSNYIQCEKCKQKFHLARKGNYIFVSTFICVHQKGLLVQCKYCRKLVQKKQYQRCKKCQLSLYFFDESRKVKCPKCNIVHCERCKKVNQLFSKQFCQCKIIKSSRNLDFFYWLFFVTIGLSILISVGSYYFDQSEFYYSIVCTIKDGYSNINCTLEQFILDTLKQFFVFIILIIVPTLISIYFENIPYILKIQRLLKSARRVRYE